MINNESGLFEVSPEAMEFLESLPKHVKISVVAVVGPYRTGKSFLANRLLGENKNLGQFKGFDIGSSV